MDETIKETAVYVGTGLQGLFDSTLSNPGSNTGQILVRVNREETSTKDMMNRGEEKLRMSFLQAIIMLETIESGPPVGVLPLLCKFPVPE